MMYNKILAADPSSTPINLERIDSETIKANIIDQITGGSKSFQLVMHNTADADAIGSALAMKELIEALVPEANVKIYLAEHLPEVRQLVAENQAAFGVIEQADQFIALDVSSAELAKIPTASYQIEQMIVVDHHHLGAQEDALNVLSSLNLNEADRAACAVLIFELFQKAGIVLSVDGAKALYVAIYKDSGGFRFDEYRSSEVSQQVVSELTDQLLDEIGQAGLAELLKSVDTPPLTANEQKERNQVVDKYTRKYQTLSGQQAVFSIIPRGYEISQRYRDLGHYLQSYEPESLQQPETAELSYLRANDFLNEKVPLVVVAIAKKDGIKLSIRTTLSAGESALSILESIGGGGHEHAAGGFISYSELDEKLPVLLEKLGMSHAEFNSLIIIGNRN